MSVEMMFINGRQSPPLYQGGDGKSIHTLLEHSNAVGKTVRCIGKINPQGGDINSFEVGAQLEALGVRMRDLSTDNIEYDIKEGFSCIMIDSRGFYHYVPKALMDLRPELVLTQLEESHFVIDEASKTYAGIVHLVHDVHPLNRASIKRTNKVGYVIFNSRFTADHFAGQLKCPYEVIYSPIDVSENLAENREPTYITMINPMPHKGGEIMRALIEHFPEHRFMLVQGWQTPETDFSLYKNVDYLQNQKNLKQVYKVAKILLVPSQYQETFGRVAVEAQLNGIPVIASKVGGLPEAVGDAGILVDDFSNINAWIGQIRSLLASRTKYESLAEAGRIQAAKFDSRRIYQQFAQVLSRVTE